MKIAQTGLALCLFAFHAVALYSRPPGNPKTKVQSMMEDLLTLRTKEGFFDLLDVFTMPVPNIHTCDSIEKHPRYFLAEFIKASDVKIVVNNADFLDNIATSHSFVGDLTLISPNRNISYFFKTIYNPGTEKPLDWKFLEFKLHLCHGYNHKAFVNQTQPTETTVTTTVASPDRDPVANLVEARLNEHKQYQSYEKLTQLERWLEQHLGWWGSFDCFDNLDVKELAFNKVRLGEAIVLSKGLLSFKVVRYRTNWGINMRGLMVDGLKNKTFYYDFDFANGTADQSIPWSLPRMEFKGCIV